MVGSLVHQAAIVDAPERVRTRAPEPVITTSTPDPRWSIAEPLKIYAASRLLVLAVAWVTVTFMNAHPSWGPWRGYGGPRIPLLQALGRWDGAWYVNVARHGYTHVRWGNAAYAPRAFFPGYPLLVRAVMTVTPFPALLAAVIVTTILGGLLVVLLWRLVAEISGAAAARRAVALFSFAPGAFVLSMAYSEALFLVATVGTIMMLIRRKWWIAGALGALASATRPNGIAVVFTCAVVAGVAIYNEREWKPIAAPIVASLGTLGYFGYLTVVTGHPFEWFQVERAGWGDRIAPTEGVWAHLNGLVSHGLSLDSGGLNDIVWLGFLGIGILCVLALWQWRPPLPVLTYGLAAAAMAGASFQVGLRPRMLLVAFPLVLAVAVRLRGTAYRVVFAASFVLLIVFSILTFTSLAVFP
jgi:hypothetical protein